MPTYIRLRNRMLNEDRTTYEDCKSISLAKKLSRRLQAAGNIVKVDRSEDPKPKPLNFKKYGVGRDPANRFLERRSREEREREVLRKKREKGMLLSRSEERKLAMGSGS